MLTSNNDELRLGPVTNKHCIACALAGNSCCTANHPFVLAADVRRAQRGLGLRTLRFFSVQRVAANPQLSAQFTSLVASLYYEYGRDRYRLQMHRSGRWCVALQEGAGCILGAFRPLPCKLFPFVPTLDFAIHVNLLETTCSVSVECQLANSLKFQAEEICSAFGETSLQKVHEARQWEEDRKQHSLLLERAARLKIAPENLLSFLVAPK